MGRHLRYHFDIVTGGVEVLRIECGQLPNTESAFLDGDVYLRNASQTVKLSTQDAIERREEVGRQIFCKALG